MRRVSPWTLYRIARRMARASRRRRPPAVAPQQSDAVGTLGVLLVMSAVVAALLQHMALAGALVAPGVFFTAIGVRAQLRAHSALEAAGLPEMDRMDGPTFERRVAALFRAQGYAVQHVGRSGDFGADLVLRRGGEVVVAQCKRYGRPVGVAAVQQVVAARSMYGARGAIVVTNATFTEAAKRLAAANGVRLMDRSAVAQLAPPSAPTSTAQSTTGGAAPGAADPLSMRRLLVSAEAATRLRFAQELAKRLGSTMHVAAAEDGVVTPVALLNCLAELREKDVLAVTDLALLAPATVDVLAETLRSGAVTVTVDIAGKPSRMARVDLPRFALVAGVASDGAAPLALRGLCGAVVRLPSAAVQRAAPTS